MTRDQAHQVGPIQPLPPLDPRFIRRICLLCCHAVRNIAYYRVGYVSEDGAGALKIQTQFGATVNSNMLDIAVLEWCKIFADHAGHHHWKRFIRSTTDQQVFVGRLLQETGISLDVWKRYLYSMRVYRDKFVAHLDQDNVMNPPRLLIALECAFLLYEKIRASVGAEVFAPPHYRALPEDLRAYYDECRDEARLA